MRIIVNNENEVNLMKKFIEAVHELGIIDLMETQDSSHPDDQYLNADDYRILTEAVFHNQTKVEIDKKEPALYYEECDFVQGTCVNCGMVTNGLSDPETLSYDDYLDMLTPEAMKTWRCESCRDRLCPCCSENLLESDEDDECRVCMPQGPLSTE